MTEFIDLKTNTMRSAGVFLSLVGDDLLSDEIRHGLIYGIAEKVSEDENVFGAGKPWFILIENQGRNCAAVIRTPPHRVILAHLFGDHKQIAAELVRAVHAVDPNIPGVVGDVEIAEPFTRQWCAVYGVEVRESVAQRIYQLTELVEPTYAEGHLRRANMDDQEIVVEWAAAFHEEALGDVFPREHYKRYRQRILDGDIFLWDDGSPVSMAAQTRPTQRGVSVGLVYTPPEKRNQGYATSCVAALSKHLLHQFEFCTLYTDLSNPTSNSIYMQIGYKAYSDSVLYSYSPPVLL
ncbi:MAG: GNAT family N-acetyltransferase [Anaerolineales bacterium]